VNAISCQKLLIDSSSSPVWWRLVFRNLY